MLIYVYSNKSLEVILFLCPFSRIIEVGFPLGPVTCLATGYGFMVLFHWQALINKTLFILEGVQVSQLVIDQ